MARPGGVGGHRRGRWWAAARRVGGPGDAGRGAGHGWDLAVATGRPYEPDPAAAQACLDHAHEFAAAVPEARDTSYGPVVPVPDDAPVSDRLLGLTGRNPQWAPPG